MPVVDKRMLEFLTQGLKTILAEECVAQGEAKGHVEGRAQALLLILSARGLVVSPATRDRILACMQLPLLDRWIRRAATAAHERDIFADC